MVDALAKEIPTFRVGGRIRCLGHVFNLSVKAILRPFSRGLRKRKDQGDTEWLTLLVSDLDEDEDEKEEGEELDEEAEGIDEEYLQSLEDNKDDEDDEEVGMASSRPECTEEELKEAAWSLFKVHCYDYCDISLLIVGCSSQTWPRRSIGAQRSRTLSSKAATNMSRSLSSLFVP